MKRILLLSICTATFVAHGVRSRNKISISQAILDLALRTITSERRFDKRKDRIEKIAIKQDANAEKLTTKERRFRTRTEIKEALQEY